MSWKGPDRVALSLSQVSQKLRVRRGKNAWPSTSFVLGR
jgi:hypothetical protein